MQKTPKTKTLKNQEGGSTVSSLVLASQAFVLTSWCRNVKFLLLSMPQWYYHNSNVLPPHRPRSSIMYNRNVTQSDSKMYYLHESSCHLQFMRELSIQSTGLAGVGSTVNLFGVKASSNTQHCKIIIIKKKKTTHLVYCSSYFFSQHCHD